jgi:alpha-tubulin suppressor-like RCC1 family protein
LTKIIELTLGGVHTCALIEGGRIRCWGHNGGGQTGYGQNEDIGDDELPSMVPDLPLPAAIDLAAGGAHTCAVFENGDVRCWGFNTSGQLGYGNTAQQVAIGDDETLEGLAVVNLIAPANEIDVGVLQTCVRVAGQLRCWGGGSYGQLGLGNVANIGDDELPLDVPVAMLGGEPVKLGVDGAHGCAIMASGGLRCWGRGDSGQLGYGSTAHIGDNEDPAVAGELDLIPPGLPEGTTIVDVGVGVVHSCVLLSSGDVLCWGASLAGQLGQATNAAWGNQAGETPSKLAPIQLGGPAVALAVGYFHSCAILDGGDVRCWGSADSGQLGNGDELPVGLIDVPTDRDPVQLGGPARSIAAGAAHTCAVLEGERVICWGSNQFGQLGYGFTHTIGDDELPEVAGLIDLL